MSHSRISDSAKKVKDVDFAENVGRSNYFTLSIAKIGMGVYDGKIAKLHCPHPSLPRWKMPAPTVTVCLPLRNWQVISVVHDEVGMRVMRD